MKKHRFNIFDIAVIASFFLIFAVCFSVYRTSDGTNGSVSYTLTVDNAEEYLVNSLKEGYDVYSENGVCIGKISSVSSEIKTEKTKDANGKNESVEYSGLYTATLTIDASALSSEKNITVNGEKIAVGTVLPFTTNAAAAKGVCTAVSFEYFDGEE